MVTLAELSAQHGSAEMTARLRKRHWSQYRLQAYGIIAILVAGLALLTLVSTVIGQARDSLTESYITLDVPLLAEEVDPDGDRSPTAIGKANFDGIVKDTLKATFPTGWPRRGSRSRRCSYRSACSSSCGLGSAPSR